MGSPFLVNMIRRRKRVSGGEVIFALTLEKQIPPLRSTPASKDRSPGTPGRGMTNKCLFPSPPPPLPPVLEVLKYPV
jgi:hypothetical protein